MGKKFDIYNWPRKIETIIKSIDLSNEITPNNKSLIYNFKEHLELINSGKPRILKYIQTLKLISEIIKVDFDKATINDIKRYVSIINSNDKYSIWTKSDYKKIFKRFFKWLKGFENTKEYPEEVKWINANVKRSEKQLPAEGDLLSNEDIQKIISIAEHPRNKALVSVLYESGCRIGEIATLQLKNIKIDKYGIVLTVYGKTGSRKIRIISSTPYLMTWIDNHPLKDNKESYVWINYGSTNHHKPMRYTTIRMLLQKLFKKAGINKKCNPHIFRHSRATFMANHLTEFQMNQYFGWIQGSDMPSTYVHLSGKNIDNSILKMNGIKVSENRKEAKIQPKICPKCKAINTYNSKFCNRCAGILDVETAMEIEKKRNLIKSTDNIMNQLLEDEELKKTLIKKIQALKL